MVTPQGNERNGNRRLKSGCPTISINHYMDYMCMHVLFKVPILIALSARVRLRSRDALSARNLAATCCSPRSGQNLSITIHATKISKVMAMTALGHHWQCTSSKSYLRDEGSQKGTFLVGPSCALKVPWFFQSCEREQKTTPVRVSPHVLASHHFRALGLSRALSGSRAKLHEKHQPKARHGLSLQVRGQRIQAAASILALAKGGMESLMLQVR